MYSYHSPLVWWVSLDYPIYLIRVYLTQTLTSRSEWKGVKIVPRLFRRWSRTIARSWAWRWPPGWWCWGRILGARNRKTSFIKINLIAGFCIKWFMKCDKIDRLSRLFTQPGTNVIFFWVGNLFEGFYSNGIKMVINLENLDFPQSWDKKNMPFKSQWTVLEYKTPNLKTALFCTFCERPGNQNKHFSILFMVKSRFHPKKRL